MDGKAAIDVFEALSNDTRLAAFRLLVRAGPDGLPAGEIAEQLGVVQNTMSSHLHKLGRAGLVVGRRRSRHIIYRVDFAVVRDLILFLMEDCCGGNAVVCGPIAQSLRSEEKTS
jgi:DNA-binding transcriptional ArsR family regulator